MNYFPLKSNRIALHDNQCFVIVVVAVDRKFLDFLDDVVIYLARAEVRVVADKVHQPLLAEGFALAVLRVDYPVGVYREHVAGVELHVFHLESLLAYYSQQAARGVHHCVLPGFGAVVNRGTVAGIGVDYKPVACFGKLAVE